MSEKRRLWKLWKADGSKDKYLDAKSKAQHTVYAAKRNAEKEKFASAKDIKENIFHVAQTNPYSKSGCNRREMYT